MPLLQTPPSPKPMPSPLTLLPTRSFLRDSPSTATGITTPPSEQKNKVRWVGTKKYGGGEDEEDRGWDLMHARWVEQPSINVINTIAMRHLPHGPFRVEFLAMGSFNQVFKLVDQAGKADFVFRVALPLDPFWKTASEVATSHYIGKNSTIPVPDVVAYDPSGDNELGFEWTIQKLMPGVTLRSVWHSLDLDQKTKLYRQVDRYMQELRSQQFRQIGNIYFQSDLQSKLGLSVLKMSAASSRLYDSWTVLTSNADQAICRSPQSHPSPLIKSPTSVRSSRTSPLSSVSPPLDFEKEIPVGHYSRSSSESLDTKPHNHQIGPLVSVWRMMRNFSPLVFNRGPYNSITEYFRSETSFTKTSIEAFGLQESIDQKETDVCLEACQEFDSLLNLAPFSNVRAGDETFVLDHRDMSGDNILIDPGSLTITAVLDWDSVSTVPRWQLDEFPKFLQSPDVENKPQITEPPWCNWPKDMLLEKVSDYYDTCLRRKFEGRVSSHAILSSAEDSFKTFDYLLRDVLDWPENLIARAKYFKGTGRWWVSNDRADG